MKILRPFLLFAFAAFSSVSANATAHPLPADTGSIVFEINGALSVQLKETSEYSYCLHHGGEVVDSQFVKKSKPFTVSLRRNETYTLSYHKEGYPAKYVVIDTHVPANKGKKEYYELAFEIELLPEHSLHKEEYKDHPVAIFKYLKNKDDFEFSTKYFEEIHRKDKASDKKGKKGK